MTVGKRYAADIGAAVTQEFITPVGRLAIER